MIYLQHSQARLCAGWLAGVLRRYDRLLCCCVTSDPGDDVTWCYVVLSTMILASSLCAG
jgi:hypothetical protein